MLGSRTNAFRSLAASAALAFLATSVGCGEEPTDEDEGAASSDRIIINCPTEVTADWIQAANGRKNVIRTTMKNVVVTPQPYDKMICTFDNKKTPPVIQQLVSFKPGSVESVCGGKATLSGRGETSGAVPPFGGFVFKSKKIQAAATYDKATGLCLLSLPTPVWPKGISIKMSQGCKTISNTAFSCPSNAYIVDTAVEQ